LSSKLTTSAPLAWLSSPLASALQNIKPER
jgi:hypothetical protein